VGGKVDRRIAPETSLGLPEFEQEATDTLTFDYRPNLYGVTSVVLEQARI
jgi:hypothetical protein